MCARTSRATAAPHPCLWRKLPKPGENTVACPAGEPLAGRGAETARSTRQSMRPLPRARSGCRPRRAAGAKACRRQASRSGILQPGRSLPGQPPAGLSATQGQASVSRAERYRPRRATGASIAACAAMPSSPPTIAASALAEGLRDDEGDCCSHGQVRDSACPVGGAPAEGVSPACNLTFI